MILRTLILAFLMTSLSAKSAHEMLELKDDSPHYICIGIDNLGEVYEMDFYLNRDGEHITGLWKGAHKLHFNGKGLALDDDRDEMVFYFSSENDGDYFEGMQHYKMVDDSYLLGSWNAWAYNPKDNSKVRITGKETCLKVG